MLYFEYFIYFCVLNVFYAFKLCIKIEKIFKVTWHYIVNYDCFSFTSLYLFSLYFINVSLLLNKLNRKCYKKQDSTLDRARSNKLLFPLKDNSLRKASTYSANSDLSRYKCYELWTRSETRFSWSDNARILICLTCPTSINRLRIFVQFHT